MQGKDLATYFQNVFSMLEVPQPKSIDDKNEMINNLSELFKNAAIYNHKSEGKKIQQRS